MLLILAGVALAILTGQGNIIGNAENAVGKYNNSVADEQQFLNEIEKYFQNYLEGGSGETPPTPPDPVEPPKVNENGLATENTTIKPDPDSDIQITIPEGFAPAILATGTTQSLPGQDGRVKEIMPADQWNNITVEDINKGIVIVDNPITYDGGNQTGTTPDFNEYVWIPIPDFEEDFRRTAWYGPYYTESYQVGKHPITDEATSSSYWEEINTTEYTDMKSSIKKFKGFYIGRYEASNNGNNIPQSKYNQHPWNKISQISAIEVSKNIDIENAHLMYGIEYDMTLNWLLENAEIASETNEKNKNMEIDDVQINSASWGNFKNSVGDAANGCGVLRNTGSNEAWKANNIYDFAGNESEWTQEKYSTGTIRVGRGGSYYYNGETVPAVYRSINVASYTGDVVRI